MEQILFELGIKHMEDYESVIHFNAFEKLDLELIRTVLNEFKLNDKNLINTDESKFQHVNLILMLKFEKIIDSIKKMDDITFEGFRLEPMP